MKFLIAVLITGLCSAAFAETTIYITGENLSTNPMKLINTGTRSKNHRGSVSLLVENENGTNRATISKKLLMDSNMDSASFIQLLLDKNLNIILSCTNATLDSDNFYVCGDFPITVSPKE